MNEKQTAAGTVRPTKKQRDILIFIENFIKEHGYSPSYREIMNGLNYTSVATVSLHINSLIRRGHLVKRDRSARSLEVVNSAAAVTPSGKKSAVNQTGQPDDYERWLAGKIDAFILGLTAAAPNPDDILKLEIVHEATKILGLQGLADDTSAKLAALQARLSAGEQPDHLMPAAV
jgi:SOS-response transcriptional repressor LexA